MATAKTIGNQAANAKRVSTSIRKLVKDLDNDFTKELILTKSEKELLIKAASILTKVGSKKSQTAKAKKSEELKREKLTEDYKMLATEIMNTWPKPTTIQDKIAYIFSCGTNSSSLKRYIENGLPLWQREVNSNDWMNMLNLLYEETIKEIPGSVAYIQQSLKNEKTLHENMSLLKEKIDAAKNNMACKNVTSQWLERIEMKVEL